MVYSICLLHFLSIYIVEVKNMTILSDYFIHEIPHLPSFINYYITLWLRRHFHYKKFNFKWGRTSVKKNLEGHIFIFFLVKIRIINERDRVFNNTFS